MTQQEIKDILESTYDRKQWLLLLRDVFGAKDLRTTPNKVRIPDNNLASEAFELGSFETSEKLLIGLYEVHVNTRVKLHRNKVTLRDLLRKTYDDALDGAFVVFKQADKWRFTFVSKVRVKSKETGERVERQTSSKRYTYLLGRGERCKTAADHFVSLQEKKKKDLFGEGVSINDLFDVFNVDKLSKDFFKEYREHYEAFITFLTGENKEGDKLRNASPFLKSTFNGDKKQARDFVKKLLGRIVFLYFLEKKGWLGVPAEEKTWDNGNANFLSDLFNDCNVKDDFYGAVLVPLFFNTLNTERKDDLFKISVSLFNKGEYNKVKIPFLNGGLFEPEENEMTQLLVFPKYLFERLFEFFDRYNFTVYEDSPEEHTVAVDPEMLGHIFENLLEDNKDKGAFYTPKEIVHYMCQESLIEYLNTKLEGKIEREALERYIKNGEAGGVSSVVELILTALRDVKVCDPAIGSGAFPMGLLLEILHAVEVLYDLNPDTVARVWKISAEQWQPAPVKQAIIQNSIYGVDIEQGAVDIARLRFWLSLVVDEEKPQPLPNLDYRIVVGDSLIPKFDGEVIDIDWKVKIDTAITDETKRAKQLQEAVAEKLHLLHQKQNEYFAYKGNKGKLQKEIRNLKIDVLIAQLQLNIYKADQDKITQATIFSDIKAAAKKKAAAALIQTTNFSTLISALRSLKNTNQQLHYFDWKLDFPEVMNKDANQRNGFDIVIANPPYVSAMNLKKALSESLYNQLKKKYDSAKGTVDLYVYFFELGLTLLKDKGGLAFITPNRYLSVSYGRALREIILEKCRINAIIDYSNVRVFKDASVYPILSFLTLTNEESYPIKIGKYDQDSQALIFNFKTSDKLTLLDGLIWGYLLNDKIEITEQVIAQGVSLGKACKINATTTAAEAETFHSLINEDNGYKLINTGTIDRYRTTWGVEKMVDKGVKYLKPYLPENSKKVSANRNRLFSSEKIILAKIAIRTEAFHDSQGIYASMNTNCLHSFSSDFLPGYILAWLNSKLYQYMFECFFEGLKMQGGYLLYSAPNLACTYIKPVSLEIQRVFSTISNYIQFLNTKHFDDLEDKLMSPYFDQILDGMFYELYFGDDVIKSSRQITSHIGTLSEISNIDDDNSKYDIIRGIFDRLNSRNHPVRINLFYLNSIAKIRKVEGKHENN